MAKKILLVACLLLFLLTGCSKKVVSTTDKIVGHVSTICKTSNSSTMRNELAQLEELVNDKSLSNDEHLLAIYAYNIAYGITKLDLSGKAISTFDFPELGSLTATLAQMANGELEITQEAVAKSTQFLQKVEDFLK